MRRRRVFRVTGTLLLGSLAGCTQNKQTNEANSLSFFREELKNNGVNIVQLEVIEDKARLKYETSRTTDQALGDEIGSISASYVLSVQNGLDTDRLSSIISNGTDDIATWHIRTEWVKQFEAEEISPDEFTAKVLNTTELVE
jgi:hypothetical protein